MFDVLTADGPPYRFRVVAVTLAVLREVFDWLAEQSEPALWRTATFVDTGGAYDMQISTSDAAAAASFRKRWV